MIRADLHFHPGFWSRDLSNTATRIKTPCMEEVVHKAVAEGIGVLSITSCSNAVERDRRWEAYFTERTPVRGFTLVKEIPNGKGLLYTANQPTRDRREYSVYIFHGQEFKTDGPDVNILFAEKDVETRPSRRQPQKVDFNYLLDAARDSGQNVIVAVRPNVDLGTLSQLYSQGKINLFETYDAMDTKRKNRQCKEFVSVLGLLGFEASVSDGHRIQDLGVSYIILKNLNKPKFLRADQFDVATMAREIKAGNFWNFENPISLAGKATYLANLVDSIAFDRFRS